MLACGFIAAWVRSFSVDDEVGIRISDTTIYFFKSSVHGLMWHDTNMLGRDFVARYPPLSVQSWNRNDGADYINAEIRNCVIGWAALPTISPRVVVIKYHTIVIPLVLLSAYLLISKPRSKSEPAHS